MVINITDYTNRNTTSGNFTQHEPLLWATGFQLQCNCENRVAQSLVFCVLLCGSLLVFFSLFLSHCIVCISLSYYNNTNFFTRNLKEQQSSSIQPTTRTWAIPLEKQTIIIVNTTNYKNTSHSPGKTNNNHRQYNQLQQHEPFPRKNKQ